MVDKTKLTTLGLTLAAAFAVSPVVQADQSPFSVSEMSSGYMLASAEGKCGEGKCGEGKCGEDKAEEGKCGEGKCGEDKAEEGKCGEGKCGSE